jgi:1-acyl-sn-glycerol-3-phosphate acyltransferase
MLPIGRGVGLVVRRARVPVIPVVIDGSYQAWPMSRAMFRPRQIRLSYGLPMQLSDLNEEEILQAIDTTLRDMLQVLRQSNGHVPAAAIPITPR